MGLNICSNESYVIEDNFDRICVKVGEVLGGYIVPNFKAKMKMAAIGDRYKEKLLNI
ncbi:MAG: hypothetical protein QM751_08440 [Paludibacteraceae bacterium]